MPEDDKTWMSIESRYHSLEFDYAPTPEQVRVFFASSPMPCSWDRFPLIRTLVSKVNITFFAALVQQRVQGGAGGTAKSSGGSRRL